MLEQFLKVSALSAPLRKAVLAHYSELAKLRADVESGKITQVPGIGEASSTHLETAFLAWDEGEHESDSYAGHGLPAEGPKGGTGEVAPAKEVRVTVDPKRASDTGPKRNIRWDRLHEPFPKSDIEWKPVKLPFEGTGKNKRKKAGKGLYVPYITNRAVMDRLDEVFGVSGWQNKYTAGPDGGVMCGIGFRDENGEWVWKHDGGENTAIEAVKGGFSVSMRRTAVQLGIGRYLYSAPSNWIDVDANHKPRKEPELPASFLPKGSEGEAWANQDFHYDPDMVDDTPEQQEPTRQQRAQNRSQRTQQGSAPPSKGEISEALYKRSTRPPKPRKTGSRELQTGDWPHYTPEIENWSWAMPQNAKRPETAKVNQGDMKQFMARTRKLGWDTDAVMLMLSDIFGVTRFSELQYAQMCGAWQIVGYRGAFDLYQSEAERNRGDGGGNAPTDTDGPPA